MYRMYIVHVHVLVNLHLHLHVCVLAVNTCVHVHVPTTCMYTQTWLTYQRLYFCSEFTKLM